MKVLLRDKKKNPDYNNIIHVPESKWKWVINATTNKCISPTGTSLKLWGWTSQTRTFSLIVKEIENKHDIYGFCSVEVQPTGGMIHYHSIWSELNEIESIKQWFEDNTGPGKKFINFFITRYQPRHISEKDFLWYMLKNPQDVFYTKKLVEEIEYYRNKVTSLEKRLTTKSGYYVPVRFYHLKHFLSKEAQENDFNNCFEKILEGGGQNGKRNGNVNPVVVENNM